METVLALFFMHPLVESSKPHYQINHCYSSNNHIIKIKNIHELDNKYSFKIEYSNQIFENKFSTVEEVYSTEVKCN